MAVLSFGVECDGFQHGGQPFTLQCLSLAFCQTRSTYMRYFNASHILEDDPAALRTYNFQTCHHGLARAGQGLPQEMANMVLLQAVNENLIALAEDGLPAPPLLIVWVKGHEKAIHHRASKNTPGGSSDPHQESRGRRLSHGDEPGPDRPRTTHDAGKSSSLRRRLFYRAKFPPYCSEFQSVPRYSSDLSLFTKSFSVVN